ncbi:hypothetical protein HU200_061865 [Digitaria exilis]|uniref:Uncharacterized protein n=1 Tax=Digitaria exilis TaxID=1010633 RepID=A0A835A6T2_9POAL|nr:hypothetical protein HU200_061865 [Digitaria exilis]
METLPNPTLVSDPPAASPRWILLEPYVNSNVSEPSIPDAKTTAASCTSTGQSFSVSFAPAAPPATSTYCCEWIGGSPGDNLTGDDESKNLHIIAVHDDCALIQMTPPESRFYSRYDNTCDYFLYEAGAGRTPCLSLLPGCYFSKQLDHDDNRQVPGRITDTTPRSLDASNTALLRLVDGELLVGELELLRPYDTADLCVLRPGREWEVTPLTIAHHGGGGGSKLPRYPWSWYSQEQPWPHI